MPDAPAWLCEAFRDGVDERYGAVDSDRPRVHRVPAYVGAQGYCWLAQHDPRRLPCTGRLERFHFIGRQRVKHALGALLPTYGYFPSLPDDSITQMMDGFDRGALLVLAEWDARNGGVACEGHHRRFDNHATPELVVPGDAVPGHVFEFLCDWGLELEAEKFEGVEVMGDFTIVT